MRFPVPRAARLQALARGESGAMLSFAYSSQRELGMPIMVGAPNIVRGGSQSGNLDARELIRLGLADIICADYHVPSLLPAAFRLVDEGLMDLPAGICSPCRYG